jgi:hypothetical protein
MGIEFLREFHTQGIQWSPEKSYNYLSKNSDHTGHYLQGNCGIVRPRPFSLNSSEFNTHVSSFLILYSICSLPSFVYRREPQVTLVKFL